MVTVELVFGMLIISMLIMVFGWAIMLFGIQIGCVDTATQVARQAARGDHQAVERARDDAPRDAKITTHEGKGQITVTVQVRSQPLDWMPAMTLSSTSTAQKEPGE